MQITKNGNKWCVSAPAKLNLFFEVHYKRDDGFHEITSLAVPVDLFDTLYFQPETNKRDISFECIGGGDIPADGRNIVVKALETFRQRYSIQQGAAVKLIKRIPIQAGLGGGSSDASAVLFAARDAWKPDIPIHELSDLSAETGSDCPLFFNNGASLISGRGEIITPFYDCPPLHFVILKPDEGLSTAEVYKKCMPLHNGKIHNVEYLLSALCGGSPENIGKHFFNRLETPAEAIWKNFISAKERLERTDCLAVRMTGSGTTFYGLCRNRENAEDIAVSLRENLKNGESCFAVSALTS